MRQRKSLHARQIAELPSYACVQLLVPYVEETLQIVQHAYAQYRPTGLWCLGEW